MTESAQTESAQRPLRLLPGLVIAGLVLLLRYIVPKLFPDAMMIGAFAGLLGGLAVLVWWVFFSRASRAERWGGALLMIAAVAVTVPLLDESVATTGMGFSYYLSVIPLLALAFVLWAALSRGLSARPRHATMIATVLLACGFWTLVRTPGVSGAGGMELKWRWQETAEERLLAEAGDDLLTPAQAPFDPGVEAEWPGFRGPGRDGIVRGVRIETDWTATPPVEVWRQPVGPGWSSFAVRGDRFYTQEQRGDDELVSCYDARTGEPVWRHSDAERFWEAMAGAGPRGTPTVIDGRVYALGATGMLNALDADDGELLWSRNAVDDTETEIPGWGIASSPLVVGEHVIVALSGRLAAYDVGSGELRWTALDDIESYSSPHWLMIDGVGQVLFMDGANLSSVAATDGEVLWKHPWAGFHSLQPALLDDGDLLIASSSDMGGMGTRRLHVAGEPGDWTVEERWTSRGLKPYFNDFVVHDGHAYGFDNAILSSIDLETGERNWKGGRYGNGQLVLLRDQGILLVISEKGELALVSAAPDGFSELARVPAIEGKTWNHPVVVDDLLLVRNDREMAAFRLPLAG